MIESFIEKIGVILEGIELAVDFKLKIITVLKEMTSVASYC